MRPERPKQSDCLQLYIYIYMYLMKNPRRASVRAETRIYGTDSPSRQKSRALSITPLHHPQKKSRLNDGLPAHAIRSTRSHRKMLHVLLTHLPPRCALTFSPAPEGQAVKRLRTPDFFQLVIYSDSLLSEIYILIQKMRSARSNKIIQNKPQRSHIHIHMGQSTLPPRITHTS